MSQEKKLVLSLEKKKNDPKLLSQLSKPTTLARHPNGMLTGKVVFLIGRRQKATPALTALFYGEFAFKGIKQSRSPCGCSFPASVPPAGKLACCHVFCAPCSSSRQATLSA